LGFVVFVLAATTGCVRETTDGSARVFSYELWLPLLVLGAGVAAAPIGWVLRKTSGRLGWGLLIVGPLAAIFFAPSLFSERAVVDEEGYTSHGGIWGLTTSHEVRFDDLTLVRITSKEVRGRRGRRKTEYYIVCVRKDGTSEEVPVNNDVTEAATLYFIEKLVDREIPVLNQT